MREVRQGGLAYLTYGVRTMVVVRCGTVTVCSWCGVRIRWPFRNCMECRLALNRDDPSPPVPYMSRLPKPPAVLCSDGTPVHDFKGQFFCPQCGWAGINA